MLNKFRPLLSYEFRRFRGKSRLALIFIVCLPLLYAGVYLGANWNLYAHVDKLNVAVINKDKPAEFQGKTIEGGKQFVDTLKATPAFNWVFTDDEDAANEGLRHGKYYMVITVPEDFSSNLVSVAGENPSRAQLRLHRDGSNGFIAGTVMSKADDVLGKTLDNAVSQTYFQALLSNVAQGRNDLVKASDGAKQLDAGLKQVADGVKTMDTSVAAAVKQATDTQGVVDKLKPSLAKIQDGVTTASEGIDQTLAGVGDLSASAGKLAGQASALEVAARPMGTFISTDLPAALANNKSIATLSASIGDAAGGSTVKINQSMGLARDSLDKLVAAHPDLAADSNVVALRKQLDVTTTNTVSIESNVHKIATASAGIDLKLDTTNLKASTDAFAKANKSIADIVAGADQAISKINSGINDTRSGLRDAQSGASAVGTQAADLVGSAGTVIDGVTQLSEGLGRLDTAAPQLSAGASQLATGLDAGVKKIPVLDQDTQQTLSTIMSTPVDTVVQTDNDPGVYGRGMAPMFFSLSLWISCISAFLVVRTLSGRAVTARSATWRSVILGFGPLAAVGTAGGLVMGGGVWLFFGLNPVHSWLFWLLVIVAELSFMSLAYMLRLMLGSPQTAMFLVLLVIQLVAAGGVFPVAMTPSFFQYFSMIAPMRYSVDGFRVAISGGSLGTYWLSIGVLLAWLAVSLVAIFALVRRRKRFRMRDLHPPMVTSSSTADYAFSVRPR